MCFLLTFLACVTAYYVFNWLIHLPKVGNNEEKYVVITGCDSGFGKLLALRLEELKFHVFAGCLTEKRKEFLSETCSSRLSPLLLDVTNEESIQNFAKAVKQNLPENSGIWAIVNNAGILGNILQADLLTREDFRKVVDVNLLGQVEMTRTFLPLVRKSRGRIINMSSVNGRLGFKYASYTASKFGVEAFSDVLRHEVYRQGIKVSIVEPGAFQTSLMNVDKIMQQVEESVEQSETKHLFGPEFLARRTVTYCSERRFTQVNHVIEACTHAITAKVPRVRYIVGWDAYVLGNIVSALPDWAADYVVRSCFNYMDADIERLALK